MAKKKKKKRQMAGALGFVSVPATSNPFASVFAEAKKKGVFGKEAYRTELSIIDIRTLAWKASEGDPFAYEKLQAENKKLARLANSRMRALEKAGLDMFAYDRAKTYLDTQGKKRFSTVLAPQSDYRGMAEQMGELVTFINAKTSTVAVAKDSLRKKLEKISEHTGAEYTAEQGRRLGKLLSNDSISTLLRDVKADSEKVLEMLEEISMDDFNEQRLITTIDRYLMGYDPFGNSHDFLTYDELMDELEKLLPDERTRRPINEIHTNLTRTE